VARGAHRATAGTVAAVIRRASCAVVGRGVLAARPDRQRHLHGALREWIGAQLDRRGERRVLARAAALELAGQLLPALQPDLTGVVRRFDVRCEGDDMLGAELARGRGVVVMASHLGFHRLLGPAMHERGHRVVEMVLPPAALHTRLPDPSRLGVAMRRASHREGGVRGPRQLPADGFLRDAARALAAGAVVVLPGDGRWGSRFRPVPFLTGRAWMPDGAARLAWLGGASLVVAHVHVDVELRPTVVVGPAHRPPGRGRTTAPEARHWIDDAVHRFARDLARRVRQHPELYLWRLGTLHRLQQLGRERFFEPGP